MLIRQERECGDDVEGEVRIQDDLVSIHHDFRDVRVAKVMGPLDADSRSEFVENGLRHHAELYDLAAGSQIQEALLRAHGDGMERTREALLEQQTNRLAEVERELIRWVKQASGVDGDLARAAGAIVGAKLVPMEKGQNVLLEAVQLIVKHIAKQEGVKETVERTGLKGRPFEEEVLARCVAWAHAHGGVAQDVAQKNVPGDILVRITGPVLPGGMWACIVEVRKREEAFSHRRISTHLESAMAHHCAQAGLYLSEDLDGLGRDIANGLDGAPCRGGRYLATTLPDLERALHILHTEAQLDHKRASEPRADLDTLQGLIMRLRTEAQRIAQFRGAMTKTKQALVELEKFGEAAFFVFEDVARAMELALRS
jgi:hypothetical protein